MKYKDMFKKWWFWVAFGVFFLFEVVKGLKEYGRLFLVEYLGMALGSFISVLFFASVIFLLVKFFKWIIKKVTKG